MAKNNGHQNFTQSLGIPTPPPYLGIIPKKTVFLLLPIKSCNTKKTQKSGTPKVKKLWPNPRKRKENPICLW